MNSTGNKYQSTIKVEFRDLICNIVQSNRKSFHMYTIHRLLSLGLLINFDFRYIDTSEEGIVEIELDLKEHGVVVFSVDLDSNYVKIAEDGYRRTLEQFLDTFETKNKSIF